MTESSETETPPCPKCTGEMWDNRVNKRNPRAPDFKCRDKSCDGVIWPSRESARAAGPAAAAPATATKPAAGAKDADGMPLCPTCGGAMWDDRLSKRNPRAPDFKCRNKPKERGGPGCEGVIWPARDDSPSPYPAPVARSSSPRNESAPPREEVPLPDEPPPFDDDDLPF